MAKKKIKKSVFVGLTKHEFHHTLYLTIEAEPLMETPTMTDPYAMPFDHHNDDRILDDEYAEWLYEREQAHAENEGGGDSPFAHPATAPCFVAEPQCEEYYGPEDADILFEVIMSL